MSPKVIATFGPRKMQSVEYWVDGTVGKRRAYTHLYHNPKGTARVPLRCIHSVSLKLACERCAKLP